METSVVALQSLLEEEKNLYGDLVELAREKQQQIIANDLPTLSDTVAREEDLLQEIFQKEKKRKELLEALGGGDVTFATLCQRVNDNLALELQGLRTELLHLLEELWEINATNSRLINDTLEFNKNTVENLARLRSSRTYGPKTQNSQQTILDQKG